MLPFANTPVAWGWAWTPQRHENLNADTIRVISKVLNEKELTKWRKSGLEELKVALEAKLDDSRQYEQRGDRTQTILITISELADIELRHICDQLQLSDSTFLLPERRTGYGQSKKVEIPATTIIRLSEELSKRQ